MNEGAGIGMSVSKGDYVQCVPDRGESVVPIGRRELGFKKGPLVAALCMERGGQRSGEMSR